jgi:hypothetical protein
LKLSIGFQKKVGQADYGSLGANCHVEFEIDPTLLHNNLDGFHEKARHAFVACQQAVNDQLARQASNGAAKNGNGNGNGNGNAKGHPPPAASPTNGTNGHGSSGGTPRMATLSQARAIRAIASRQRLDLQKLLGARFGVGRPENLRLADASSLIDELKNPGDEGGDHR